MSRPIKLFARPVTYLAALLTLAAASLAQQVSIQLPADHATSQLTPGPGEELARSRCVLCHSLDYIVGQPRLSAAQWEGEVRKMATTYGAPLSEPDIRAISDYLARNYGAPVAAAPNRPPAPAPAR